MVFLGYLGFPGIPKEFQVPEFHMEFRVPTSEQSKINGGAWRSKVSSSCLEDDYPGTGTGTVRSVTRTGTAGFDQGLARRV